MEPEGRSPNPALPPNSETGQGGGVSPLDGSPKKPDTHGTVDNKPENLDDTVRLDDDYLDGLEDHPGPDEE